jgi:predicted membrane protein
MLSFLIFGYIICTFTAGMILLQTIRSPIWGEYLFPLTLGNALYIVSYVVSYGIFSAAIFSLIDRQTFGTADVIFDCVLGAIALSVAYGVARGYKRAKSLDAMRKWYRENYPYPLLQYGENS